MPDEKEKESLEKIKAEKDKEKPWYGNLSPAVLAGAALVGFFLLSKISSNSSNKNNLVIWIFAILAILYIMSQTSKKQEDVLVSPKEAELLVERECERKRRWGQFDSMASYKIGPVSYLQRRDGGGMYYDVAVEVTSPYNKPEFYNATVMAKGPERGFTTLAESIGGLTGRDKVAERTIVPQWMRDAEKRPILEKMFMR